MILLREFKSNLLVANDEVAGFRDEGARRSLRGQELDNGEPLDGSIVGALLVLVLRNVDITQYTVLLKDILQLINGDVTGQIAGDKGLDFLWIVEGLRAGRENGRRRRSRDLVIAEVKAIQLGIDCGEVGRSIIRLEVCVQLSFLLRRRSGIIPLDISLEQVGNQRILQGLHTENKVELLEGRHGRME